MHTIRVLSGDLGRGHWFLGENAAGGGGFLWRATGLAGPGRAAVVPVTNSVSGIRVLTQRRRRRMLPTAALGAAGWFLLGPFGALGGLLLAGDSEEFCFLIQFADRRSAVAVADFGALNQLLALCFGEPGFRGPVIDLDAVPAGASA